MLKAVVECTIKNTIGMHRKFTPQWTKYGQTATNEEHPGRQVLDSKSGDGFRVKLAQ